jgi:protein-tyrosine phosphatase
MQYKVMFVCLGNICRSPLAKALFEKHIVKNRLQDRFYIDSAGTSSNHSGESADSRTLLNAKNNGLVFTHEAKQFTLSHFKEFDLIVVMDRSNEKNVKSLSEDGELHKKVHLMRKWDITGTNENVPDPWYGGPEGFEDVFKILNRSTAALLQDLTTG